VVSFTTRPLYPREKNPRYSLDKRLCGSKRRSERGGGEKNSQPPPGIETGRWCNIFVLNVHAPNEDKSDDIKDRFVRK
jgi:hypothetical protein